MFSLGLMQYLLIGLSAFLAGGVNALAGGGTLITFPLLTALGIPAVAANVTNTVALCPGYFGATLAQWKVIKQQKARLFLYVPVAILGGVSGGLLLLYTREKMFHVLVPYLILLASVLLAMGEPLRELMKRTHNSHRVTKVLQWIAVPAVFLAAVYGGYFGAGLSVILLAILGFFLNDSLTKLNALKQVLAMVTNVAAAVLFIFSSKVYWWAALVMAFCALAGGMAGGKLAGKINPLVLRWLVVSLGVVIAGIYFIKG